MSEAEDTREREIESVEWEEGKRSVEKGSFRLNSSFSLDLLSPLSSSPLSCSSLSSTSDE